MGDRKIEIKGKKNTDALLGRPTRRSVLKGYDNLSAFTEAYQISCANRMFMGEDFAERKLVENEVTRKLTGYRAQDKKNEVWDHRNFVSLEDVTELLVASRLKCFYCLRFTPLVFEEPNHPAQWTLDRIDNNQGHNRGNVKIACLGCNVKRGTSDSARFKESKIVRVDKKE